MDNRSPFRPLWPLFRPHRLWLWGGAALAGLTLLSSIALLALSGWFITAAGVAGLSALTAASFDIFRPGAGVRFFAMSRTGSRYGERLVTHEATLRILAGVRVWLFSHLIPLSPRQLHGLHRGDLLNRLTADIDALDGLYLRVIIPLAVALLGSLATGGLLWWLVGGPPALAVTLLLLLGGLALPLATLRAGLKAGGDAVQAQARLRTRLMDALGGVAELRAFGACDRHSRRVDEASAALYQAQARISRLNGVAAALSLFLSGLALWAALLFGGMLVRAGQSEGALMVLGVLATLAAFEAVAPAVSAGHALGRLVAAARRITSIALQPPEMTAPACPAPPLAEPAALVFREVCFAYHTPGPMVLNKVSLTLNPGEAVALLGESGAGKSTLAALALRRLDPQSGTVTLGGADLRTLDPATVHRRIGWLSQRGHIFADTLRANLLLADPQADEDRLWQVLEQVDLANTVRAWPEGLDTWAGEGGVRLSGGQRRRLLLARTLLQDTPFVILDEPTEGLDPATARTVISRTLRALEGRGLLLITHQTAGLESMRKIMKLQDGTLSMEGHSSIFSSC